MSRLFTSSVPNTYAATLASLRLGWGGLRQDSFVRLEWVKGKTNQCDCGLIKYKESEACFRCRSLDELPANTAGLILDALADGEGMTSYQLADACKRGLRQIVRCVKPLVEQGRLRTWMEDRDPYDLTDAELALKIGPAARFTRQVLSPIRMFRRVW